MTDRSGADSLSASNPTCLWALSWKDGATESGEALPLLANTIEDYGHAIGNRPADATSALNRYRGQTADYFCRGLGFDRASGWEVARLSDDKGASEQQRGRAVTIGVLFGTRGVSYPMIRVEPRLYNGYYGRSVGPMVFSRLECAR
jgi:hypothetical protein